MSQPLLIQHQYPSPHLAMPQSHSNMTSDDHERRQLRLLRAAENDDVEALGRSLRARANMANSATTPSSRTHAQQGARPRRRDRIPP